VEAKEYLNLLKNGKEILRLVHYTGDAPDGRGRALIINEQHQIAVMLEDCHFSVTGVGPGHLVKYARHPEGGDDADGRIVGTPAMIR